VIETEDDKDIEMDRDEDTEVVSERDEDLVVEAVNSEVGEPFV